MYAGDDDALNCLSPATVDHVHGESASSTAVSPPAMGEYLDDTGYARSSRPAYDAAAAAAAAPAPDTHASSSRRAREQREARLERQKLRGRLLQLSVAEWELDCEVAGELRAAAATPAVDAEPIPYDAAVSARCARAVGKLHILTECALLKELKLEKLTARERRTAARKAEVGTWLASLLESVFAWDAKVAECAARAGGDSVCSGALALADELYTEAHEREQHAEVLVGRMQASQAASAEALAVLRQAARRRRQELKGIAAEREAHLAQTEREWAENLDALEDEAVRLRGLNKELRFHVRRGSNYKEARTGSAVAAYDHTSVSAAAAAAGGHRTEDTLEAARAAIASRSLSAFGKSPSPALSLLPAFPTPDAAAESAKVASARRRLAEEVEAVEAALQADRAMLLSVQRLVARRQGERDDLSATRDALASEVEFVRSLLREGSPAVNADLTAVHTCVSARRARAQHVGAEFGAGATPGAVSPAASSARGYAAPTSSSRRRTPSSTATTAHHHHHHLSTPRSAVGTPQYHYRQSGRRDVSPE
eukprot:Rhum_TRINITY_DN13668_c0_g2::Rhum_TRINITY_DN13668_c0_g2_i1::g.62597::m.62597